MFPLSVRAFRFEQAWFADGSLSDLVKIWWDEVALTGCSAFIMAKKFKFL